jgi:hypothetical protein
VLVEQERRKYFPHAYQPNKIPNELFLELDKIIYESGYLCYHDYEGCNHVLSLIVNILHQYKIEKGKC